MKRTTIVSLVITAVLAAGAVASASASATTGPVWHEQGSALKSGKAASMKVKNRAPLVLTYKEPIETAMTCRTESGDGKIMGGEPGTGQETIQYTECSTNNGFCPINGPIEMKLKTELVYYAGEGKRYIGELISPASEGIFTKVQCTNGETFALAGNIVGELLNEAGKRVEVGKESEAVKASVQFAGSSTESYENNAGENLKAELRVGGIAATMTGTEVLTLSSGNKFGAFQ